MNIKKCKQEIFFYLNNPQGIHPIIKWKFKRLLRLTVHPIRFINYLISKNSKPCELINFKPRHIIFYPTDKCNLNCKWCLRNSDNSKSIQHSKIKDLDLLTLKEALRICPSIEAVSFTGQGEPLLNKDMFKMIGYASREDLSIFLTTNAILLNDEKISQIMRYNIARINISLKGKDGREFIETTGLNEKLFYRQTENIGKLVTEKKKRKHNGIIRISYIVDKNNFKNMEEVIRLAENLGVDRLLFDNIVPFDDFTTGHNCIFEDNVTAKKYIEHLKKTPRKVKIEFPILLKRNNFSYYCPGYYNFVNIDADGNISGCMRVLPPSPEYGNIFKDKDYMNTPHFRKMRRMYLHRQLPPRCRFCVEMSREENY